MKAKLSSIVRAIESTDLNKEYYLDRETGEVVLNPEIRDWFIRLPTAYEINAYDIIGDFVSTLTGTKRKHMLNSIIGSKSFSCFREDIRSLGLEDRWLAFRDEACR